MESDQLGLLLWKNYVIRKRQPGILALVFLWPVMVFLILYTVRDNIDPQYKPTCQFSARLMPQDGLLPFMQNFICGIGNPCEPLSEYEEVPSYSNATLSPLIKELQPVLGNQTILSVVSSLPQSIKLLKSMGQILTQPSIKKIFENGILLGDLFSNHEQIKRFFKREVPELNETMIENLFNSSIKIQYLIGTFASSNMDDIVCSPTKLEKYLIVPLEEDLAEVSNFLCHMNTTLIPDLMEHLAQQLDFNGLLVIFNRVMAKFQDYDFLEDLRKTSISILQLRMVDKYVPHYLRLQEWVPKIIPLFKNVTFKEIDLSFINESLNVLNPIFDNERNWPMARNGFLNLNSLLEMVKGMLSNRTTTTNPLSDNISGLTQTLGEELQKGFNKSASEDVSQILDAAWPILQTGVKLTNLLLLEHKNDILVGTEVLDGLRNFLSKNVLNTATHLVSFLDNIVQSLHHIAFLHQETPQRIDNVTRAHKKLIDKILKNLEPTFYETIINSFSRLDLVERFFQDDKDPGEVFCEERMLNDIFHNFTTLKTENETIRQLLCGVEGKEFITQIANSFELHNFKQIVENVLSTLILMVLKMPVPIEKANLTSTVRNVNKFVAYLNAPRLEPDWKTYALSEDWIVAINSTAARGRLDILGIHLSIAKAAGSRSPSKSVIVPSLDDMSFYANEILKDLQMAPKNLTVDVRTHLPELIESFYLTVMDRPKVLNILEVSNFTLTYCFGGNSPRLVNFPSGSNETGLKYLICQLSKSVQHDLEMQLNDTEIENRPPFNWTTFNERIIGIYSYIDEVVHQEYRDYDWKRIEKLKAQFADAWTKDVTTQDAWEMSVGLICKLFDIMESPVFGIRRAFELSPFYNVVNAADTTFSAVKDLVDYVHDYNKTVKLSDLLVQLPESVKLGRVILNNLPDLINDTMGPKLPDIPAIVKYREREQDWPCVHNQSIGEVLEIRDGTREIVRGIERVACDPHSFIKEWKAQPTIKAIQENLTMDEEATPFNWTQGYTKFRYLVENFSNLLNDSGSIIISDVPTFSLRTIGEAFKQASNKSIATILWGEILESFDNGIDKWIGVSDVNETALDVWNSVAVKPKDKIIILAKFFAHVIYETSALSLDILNEGPEMNLLHILGFTKKTTVSMAYSHFPDIIATAAIGLSDPKVVMKIVQSMEKGTMISCDDLFSWFVDSREGISLDEFIDLKNMTCDFDPIRVNEFTDLVLREELIWKQPVVTYPSYIMRAGYKLYDLGKAISEIVHKGLKIKHPFSEEYFYSFTKILKERLEQHQNIPQHGTTDPIVQHIQLVENGVAEVLNHIARSLTELKLSKNELNLSDLFQADNIQQLLKILEAHPAETISLMASLAWMNSTTGQILPFKELRKQMCHSHFGLDYWTEHNKTRFLLDVCHFDPHQLLKNATSETFYDEAIRGYNLRNETSVIKAVTTLLDATLNLKSMHPGMVFKSNILNFTTWKNLDNATALIVERFEKSWLHYLTARYTSFQTTALYPGIVYFVQFINPLIDILSGGDVWQKLKTLYENKPQMKLLLKFVEDMPNFIVTILDSFLKSEKLSAYVNESLTGRIKMCDIDKYLDVPKYIESKELLANINDFCKHLGDILDLSVVSGPHYTLPLEKVHEICHYDCAPSLGNESDNSLRLVMNETLAYKHLKRFQTLLLNAFSDEFENLKVPKWLSSFQEGTLKNFLAEYKSKDRKELSHLIVRRTIKVLGIYLKTVTDNRKCSWCTMTTFYLDVLNSQLSQHAQYSELLCNAKQLNFTQIQESLNRDFRWNDSLDKIRGVSSIGFQKKTVDDFLLELDDTLQYLVDIIINFMDMPNRKKIDNCFKEFLDGSLLRKPRMYVFLLTKVLDLLHDNHHILDTASNHEKLMALSKIAEKTVPIWMPLREVVKSSDVDLIDGLLPNASINVNMVDLAITRNATAFYTVLKSKRFKKLFRFNETSSNLPSISNISEQLSKSLDHDLIQSQITLWRRQATWNMTWLKNLLKNLGIIISEGGNLLDVASHVDFDDVSNAVSTPDLIDGVVKLFRDNTIDKLFEGMNELMDDIEPFIEDPMLKEDLRTTITTLESMEIFKNLGLLNMKYAIKDMFANWDVLKTYLNDTIGLKNEVVMALSQGKVDMLSVFTKERQAMSIKDTLCSPQKLEQLLNFEQGQITADDMSVALCQLDGTQTQNIAVTLIKNLNFEHIFKDLMSVNVKNVLSNANMTEEEGKAILRKLRHAGELLPFFKDKIAKLSDGFSSAKLIAKETGVDEASATVSSTQFLADAGEMMCGRPIMQESSRLYKVLSSIADNNKEVNDEEQNSLPTEFCKEMYRNVINMGGGKVIWSYIKPLMRGQILYAPNTTVIKRVMTLANHSFAEMNSFGNFIESFDKSLTSFADLTELGDGLKDLQGILSSDVMKIAVKSLSGSQSEKNSIETFGDLDLSKVASQLKNSKRLTQMVGMLDQLMDCVLIDRFIGFATEEELENEAARLSEANEFLAGVVFLDNNPTRTKRSLGDELPDNITYKIRMDVDSVPTTTRTMDRFWTPGPEASFIQDLRYQRGFIQLQDSIDRAIIRLKTNSDQNWKTLTQQMPYPCWSYSSFQTTLQESQALQSCFFFALMMCVGAAVRYIVWERESQNAMVMSVMGLKPWRNTLAWYITSLIEFSVVMISTFVILIVGKILPNSDPLLILLLLFDYAFATVTFCYMISTMFSSASLASLTAVVIFLTTYQPYIIVVSLEASMSLAYKLLISLSMSTSFCYGCLFAVRREVQGTGLSWGTMWDESSPGDPMSLGLALVMLFFDGCLYALIGYIVAKYTNSGRGFHRLRSRSLWWSDKRTLYGGPSYFTFENDLYFTNDVAHPSSTHQEDYANDANLLTIHEKQVGVNFDAVRKVYQTEQGECVAVDDFTLQLCEGEVTTLLGRNGAGKTTIIKMLTGMLAPTSGKISLSNDEGKEPNIGVCPQNNVLIGSLTPREHLIFYAKLKKSSANLDVLGSVNEMLTSMELGRQENEVVSRLSGGTQRRLCVALAFLGSPKLVILDEPGAGVDPAARRRIWRLIDKHRVGRTILLSTHHLDEADMLSDTVVIMHKGRILCTGSPLTLKLNNGLGYKLTVSFPLESTKKKIDEKTVETLNSIVENLIPNALFSEVTNSEASVILPFQGNDGGTNDIAEAAKALEDNQTRLGYSHFSLECDTLERVFLDLCARAENGQIYKGPTSLESISTINSIGLTISTDDIDLISEEPKPRPTPYKQGKALIKKRLWHFARDWRSPFTALFLPTMFVTIAMAFSLVRPRSDNEPALPMNPELYNIHPSYFYSIDNSSDEFLQRISMQIHNRFGDDHAWQVSPNDTGTCDCVQGKQVCQDAPPTVDGLFQTLPGRPTLDWIISTHQQYIEKRFDIDDYNFASDNRLLIVMGAYEKGSAYGEGVVYFDFQLYGGWSLSHSSEDPLFVVWYNNKGHHAMTTYLSALNEAILRAFGVDGHLTTINHPIKSSRDQLNQTSISQHVSDVGVALVLLVAFSLVGAQGSRELVRERLSEEKRILYLAGVHPVTYWTTALIWDILIFGCSIALAVIVFIIFGLPTYTARENLAASSLLLFLFAWAVVPLTHLTEKLFNDASLSNMVLFCVNSFIGVAFLTTILIIDILGTTKSAENIRNVLNVIFLAFPQYAFGDGLVQMTKNDITAELLGRFHMDTYKSPLSWDLIGGHYVYLFVVGTIFYILNLIIECRLIPNIPWRKVQYETVLEDEDVVRERTRVEEGLDIDVLKIVNLRKEYRSVHGNNLAVQNLSFGIQHGQCFGLLGVNGAGKSTTFKMLTTEIIPTAGQIILEGRRVGSEQLCSGEVGYCPQGDALDPFLTPYECLTTHGEVCGLRNVPKAVDLALKRFDLTKYAYQRVDGLSGGNKRKLCAAISVMAPSSVILMDEPTSGMDPASKELVARAIRYVTKNGGSVLLTSHNVAESEKLCSRVGVLARAGLRCIGSPEYLKHKYGEGYIVFLRFKNPMSPSELRLAIARHLPCSSVASRQALAARLLVPRCEDTPLSVVLTRVRRLADELEATEYTLTQSSLDQVLVNFSEELEDETSYQQKSNGRRSDLPNMYSSVETIHMDTLQF